MNIGRRIVHAAALLATFMTGAVVVHAQARNPVIQDRVTLDASQPVGFHVLVVPDTVYVGQQATYEMGVFISESAQQRMRRNPEVVPAELRGVLAYDLGGPQSLTPIVRSGVRLFPHVLQRALFPLANGRIVIPASQLSYALPRSASYFSREESAVVRASELSLHVKALPDEGRPSDFSGAVGVLTVGARVDATQVRVGNPVVLTLRVGGRGNVKLWPRPSVRAAQASLVPAGERVRVDTSGQYVRGTKEFDWLVTPEQPGRLVIPVVQYPYFDPYEVDYRVASSDSLVLTIGAGEFTPLTAGSGEREVLSLRRGDRGALPPSLPEQPLAWALLAFAPVPALWWRRRRNRMSGNTGDAASIGPESGRPSGSAVEAMAAPRDPVRVAAASLRRQVLVTLAAQLDTTGAMLVERRLLERRLRRRGVTRETTAEVMQLLADLDEAAWSPPSDAARRGPAAMVRSAGLSAAADVSWADRIRVLSRAVETEAMAPRARAAVGATPRRREGVSPGNRKQSPLLWLFIFVGALSGLSLIGGGAQLLNARGSAFTAAVAEYDGEQYQDALAGFLSIARAAPRDADAWANAGTAAWAAGDTVQSVIGWQRALRLEPTARDVRERLALFGAASSSGVAYVPSLPRDAATWLALAAWCLGWAVVALAQRPPASREVPRVSAAWAQQWRVRTQRAGLGLLMVAAASSVWAWQVRTTRDGAALAVVAHLEPLRIAPGDASNAVGGTVRGDIVSRGREQLGASGALWVEVQHADGRTGWLPARALQSLTGT